MFALLFMTALCATDAPPAAKAPLPGPAPATGSMPVAAAAPDAAQAPARRRVVRQQPARIDEKRPYMRVWYWPPMPPQEAPTPFDMGSGNATAGSQGAPDPRGNKLDDVNFPVNRSKVVDEQAQLEHLAQWMKANPVIEVVLDGYADPRGGQKHNQELATSRAQAVKSYLVEHGVKASRITAVGHGSSNPLRGGTQDESYWLSRRVAIRFKNAPKEGVVPQEPAKSEPKAAGLLEDTHQAAPAEKED